MSRRHFGLRPWRTHKTFTQRCACGWESEPVPHGNQSMQLSEHLEQEGKS